MRAFAADQPSEARIHGLLDAAVHALTAMHQEPWRFVVIQDRAILARLSQRAKAMALRERAQHGTLRKRPRGAVRIDA